MTWVTFFWFILRALVALGKGKKWCKHVGLKCDDFGLVGTDGVRYNFWTCSLGSNEKKKKKEKEKKERKKDKTVEILFYVEWTNGL